MNTDQLLASTYAPLRLSVGTRLRAGTVAACVGGGPTGYVYRVLDERGHPIAVREYFPPALATRLDDSVCPQAQCDAAFEAGLKLFDEDGWQMAAHQHPGLLKVQHIWTERGTSYQSMPWCEGRTLDLIVRAVPVSPSQAELSDWLRAMADALGPIHRRHGLHGHLSPSQVMRLDSGRLLLMEFSRARRHVARDPRDIERNPYAALECGNDARYGPTGPWTDIYALAAIVAFALRGRAPMTPARRLPDDTQEPLTQSVVGDYSADFLQGIDAGLALRPRARPRDLNSFLARLGLHERRSRPRTPGESLLVNLHLADKAPPLDEATDMAAAESEAASVIEAASARRSRPMAADAVDREVESPQAEPAERPVQIAPDAMPSAAPRQPARTSMALAAVWLLGLGAVAAVMAIGVASFDRTGDASSSAAIVAPDPAPVASAGSVDGAASAALAASPIPEPLEPTAAGPATDAPVDVTPDVTAEAPPTPKARALRPAAVPAVASALTEAPVDLAAPTSPCPELLARQYIGRRLDDAERAQMNAQCR